MACGIDLFLIYKELRICQEFSVILLTSFFLPSGCLRLFGLLPLGVKNLFLGCVFVSGSHFISVPLGTTEGGSRLGLPCCEYFIRSSQTESWR